MSVAAAQVNTVSSKSYNLLLDRNYLKKTKNTETAGQLRIDHVWF